MGYYIRMYDVVHDLSGRMDGPINRLLEFDADHRNIANTLVSAGLCGAAIAAEAVSHRLTTRPASPLNMLGAAGCRMIATASTVMAFEHIQAWRNGDLDGQWFPPKTLRA